MRAVQKSIRIPEDTLRGIEELAKESDIDFSAIAKELLEEALKMRRCPGIVFAEGANGRRARVAGTGIEVWEIIASYQSVGGKFERLKKAYHWLSPEQLRASLVYYSLYGLEIDKLIDQNKKWTLEKIKTQHMFMKPQP
ncbi:MAG: hypothetical protein A2161_22475 [Candidatus Schekmanbacteria bacterium RBG_13_48_7]|uniref:Uncharacterized protein n=1 Tax=Candidatus Schekmanbacteria bacterium RBG_13_48_7 TaxID=1817878 RepID=A0A1F7RJW6_9BACT|nr:MAG: hypothetical protein A2161_22475 [Candidatus Schekmanbacteria bacterium RBG_13_48_7]